MKIGILTFHRAHNYGAVLQCFALQEILKRMGFEVEVIDYKQKFIEDVYKPFNLKVFLSRFIRLRKDAFSYLLHITARLERKKIYEEFLDKHITMSPPCLLNNFPCYYDAVIIGSDQMWNTALTGGLDKMYWGFFSHKYVGRVIGYAISTNIGNLSQIPRQTIQKVLCRFVALSMREIKLSNFINRKYHPQVSVKTVLDPTLLPDKSIWRSLVNDKFKDRQYILIYQARSYADRPNILKEKASVLADMMDCEIIDLSQGLYSPEDFVSAFKYARYVITTSFHAVAFSLIFNKPLYAIKLNDGHDGRYVDLLNEVGANCFLVDVDFIPEYVPVDYALINQRLNDLRQKSIRFLERSLNS